MLDFSRGLALVRDAVLCDFSRPPPTLHIPPSLLPSLPHVPPPLSMSDAALACTPWDHFIIPGCVRCGSMSIIACLNGKSSSL
jgi:hypothetical protein